MTAPLDQLVDFRPPTPPTTGNGNGHNGHNGDAVADRSAGTDVAPGSDGTPPAHRSSLLGWFRNRPVAQKVLAAPLFCVLVPWRWSG